MHRAVLVVTLFPALWASAAASQEAPDEAPQPAVEERSALEEEPAPVDEQTPAPAEEAPRAEDEPAALDAEPAAVEDDSATVERGSSAVDEPPAPIDEQPAPAEGQPAPADPSDDVEERPAAPPAPSSEAGAAPELALSDVGIVVGSTAAACTACFAGPAALAGLGCLTTFLLTSAGSPCAVVPGGTAAALYTLGGATCVVTPLLFGPIAGSVTSAAAGGSAFFVIDDWRLALQVLAGALPGFLVGLASLIGIGGAAAIALFTILTLFSMGTSAVLTFLVFSIGLLVAATIGGGMAGPLVLAGVTTSALAHSELLGDDEERPPRSERAGQDARSGPALARAAGGGVMSF